MSGARLGKAFGDGADFSHADLRDADLKEAFLLNANFTGAKLRGANLLGADLKGADLTDAKLPDFQLPTGELLGYKKVSGGVILTLGISKERTACLTSNKCRCRSAKVLRADSVLDVGGKRTRKKIRNVTKFVSLFDPRFIYSVGKTVSVDNWSDDIRIDCVPGIHFFKTFEEACDYYY